MNVLALIEFLATINRLIDLYFKLREFSKNNDFKQWLSEVEKSIDPLLVAESDDEKKKALHTVLNLLKHLD